MSDRWSHCLWWKNAERKSGKRLTVSLTVFTTIQLLPVPYFSRSFPKGSRICEFTRLQTSTDSSHLSDVFCARESWCWLDYEGVIHSTLWIKNRERAWTKQDACWVHECLVSMCLCCEALVVLRYRSSVKPAFIVLLSGPEKFCPGVNLKF